MKYLLRFILTLSATLGFYFNNFLFSQTFNSGTNVAWVVPAGVTSIKVETWGAGGRGGSFTTNGTGNRGGGGGGAYASSVINVTSGATYYYTVGTGSNDNSIAGGDSWFSTTSTSSGAIVHAKGGSSASTTASTGAAGGSYSASIGQVRNNGGRGADGSTSGGGGGGSSAGATNLGVNATNQFGAVGPTGNDGIGGNGGASGGNNAGSAGIAPGGGGGGAFRSTSGTIAGGNGANGRVIITVLGPQLDITTTSSVQNWVAPENVTSIEVEAWGGGGRGGTRTISGTTRGGGGGGYSRGRVSVTPGTTYYINVGLGSVSSANAGGDSWFNVSNSAPTTDTYVLAKGGSSVADNNNTYAVTGGLATLGYGNVVKYNGGNGALGTASAHGGGGGSSAGYASAGNYTVSTVSSAGGVAPLGGANGGAGSTNVNTAGSTGVFPGGGGGGVYRTSAGSTAGGNGANGKVTIHTFYNLSITKTVTTTTPLVGTNVTFTITVTNNGANNANGIVVTDVFPTGITYVSNSASATFNAGTLTWNVGTLNPAASASINIVATVNASGNYANTANLTANLANNGNSSSIITLFPQKPTADLQLTKEINNTMPTINGQVTFTLTAYNAGPQNATNVKVQDILPFGFTYVSSSAGYDNNTGIWTIGTLNKAASQVLTLTASVNAFGNYYNQAVVSANEVDPNQTNNTSGISVYPIYPIIEVVLPCATTTYNLNNITVATPPSGSQISWHTSSPATNSNKIATPTNVRAGERYFVAFYNSSSNCYGATSEVLIKRSCLITNPMIRQRTK